MQIRQPLAELLRPKKLSDIFGQDHICGQQGALSRLLQLPHPSSLIFWGPPGTGKTSLARIIINHYQAQSLEINAVHSGSKDIRDAISRGQKAREIGQVFVLFVDEIHRFNKAQQAGLLESVENGQLVLLGNTTENPSFAIINPLLSRCRLLALSNLDNNSLLGICNRALAYLGDFFNLDLTLAESVQQVLIQNCSNDARRLVHLVEEVVHESLRISKEKIDNNKLASKSQRATLLISDDHLQNLDNDFKRRLLYYDKMGDKHYDTISAFIKSVRGSDPDAAIFYLAWMLEAGEDPSFIARRLTILAAEDIGLANSMALLVAEAALRSIKEIGMPEARIILAEATIYLAASPKSNRVYMALEKALQYVRKGDYNELHIPMHLRNAPTTWSRKQGHGRGYLYPHDYPDAFVHQEYRKERDSAGLFYQPSQQGAEQRVEERLKQLWPSRYLAAQAKP